MQRSGGSLYVAPPSCGGSAVTIPPLLTTLSTHSDQQQQQHHHHQHYSVVTPIDTITLETNLQSPNVGRSGLKRKLPLSELEDHFPVSVTVAPYGDTVSGPHGTKQRKDVDGGIGVELHEFPAFGQAFQGVSGIGQFYVIGANDTNNNHNNPLGDAHDPHQQPHQQQHHHHHHHHQLATYIYDVPADAIETDGTEVIPISEHHLTSTVLAPVVSDVVHQTNGSSIVLTDISSSTWTSTAELLDLDRKASAAATVPTNVHHHRYSIVSTEHQLQQQQQQQHQQTSHQQPQHHHHHQQQQQQQQQQQHHHHHHLTSHHHHQQHHHHSLLQHIVPPPMHTHHHHQPQQQSTSSPTSPRTPTLPPPPPPPPPGPAASSSADHVHAHRNNQEVNQQQQYGGSGGSTGDSSPYNGINNQSSSGNWSSAGEPGRPADGNSPRRAETTTPASSAGLTLTNGMKTPERLASQTPDTPEDCKNLSWLLNFKLDDIPNLSPRSNRKQRSKAFGPGTGTGTASNQDGANSGGSGAGPGSLGGDSGTVAIEEGDLNVGENVTIESSNGKSPKKPPFTYTELIEYALEEQGDLTVAAIYQWIS
uniref:Fork-head domain-containing protein n=1 Tax=Anopheles epiroticus TaxID=199890 RepID=A0A182P7V0_9DIPT